MTRPAVPLVPSLTVEDLDVANDLNVGRDAEVGRNVLADGATALGTNSLAASGVAFYGGAPVAKRTALTAPLLVGAADLAAVAAADLAAVAAADLAAVADPDATDLASALVLVNALKADRNGAVQTLANSLKTDRNNAVQTLANALKADRNGAVELLVNALKTCHNPTATATQELRTALGSDGTGVNLVQTV